MIRERFVTAVVLAAILLLALFALPPIAGSVLFGVLLLIGAWEWAALGELRQTGGRLAYAAAALAVGWLVWALGTSGTSVATLALVDLAVWVIGLIWMLRYPIAIPRAFTLLSGLIVLPIGWWLVTGLLSDRGPWWVLLLFGIVAAADIGAFFSGRAFGRVRLAPAVSPGKTWEGVIGGLLCSALVGVLAGYMLNWSLLAMALLAVAIGAISVIGDLTISMLKRTAGLKDSGRIFPGHGGVLDRIDSLLAALPVYLLGLGVVTGS